MALVKDSLVAASELEATDWKLFRYFSPRSSATVNPRLAFKSASFSWNRESSA